MEQMEFYLPVKPRTGKDNLGDPSLEQTASGIENCPIKVMCEIVTFTVEQQTLLILNVPLPVANSTRPAKTEIVTQVLRMGRKTSPVHVD